MSQWWTGKFEGVPALLMLWAALFVGLSVLLPNHYSPWLSFQQEWCAALAIAPLVGWALIQKGGATPKLAWLALFAGCVAVGQWLAGLILFHGDAAMALLYWWGAGLAIVAGARVVDWAATRHPPAGEVSLTHACPKLPGLKVFAPMWAAIVLACVVSLGISIHQWLDLSLLALFVVDLKPGARPYANLAQPNQLSTLFFLGLLGSAFLFEARKIGPIVGILSSGIMCLGLALTQSRSAMLIIVWLLIVYFALRKRSGLRILPTIPLALTAAYAGLSLAWPAINRWLMVSDSAVRAIDRTTAGQRAIYWRSMLDAIAEHPFLGFGFQQLNMAQRATALDYPATYGFFESSHNLVLDLMGWAGVPFALLVLACGAVWLFNQWQRSSDGLAWATIAAVGVFVVHSMVEFPLYYAYYLLPAGLWIGGLSASSRIRESTAVLKKTSATASLTWLAAGLTCALLFVWVADEYMVWEEDWRTALFEEMGYMNTPPAAKRDVVLLNQIGDFLWFSRYEAKPDMPVEDIERAQRLARRESNAMVMFKYAKVAALNGKPSEALHYLRLYQSLHAKKYYAQARRDWMKAAEVWPQLKAVSPPPAEF